jgi:serine/threonine-protein kinase HipA
MCLDRTLTFLLSEEEAQKIVNDMKAQVQASWYETLRASGVTENDAEAIRGAFVYPGFSL